MIITLFAIGIWILCGILTFGLGFAYCQKEFPKIAARDYKTDILFWISISLSGPMALIGLLITIWDGINTFKHGVKFK